MQRGVLEVMFDECRTEIWVIDPGALCDTKLWLGKAGRIPSSTELDEYEYAGSGPMDVLMSLCLSAQACRLWWFDELGAEYWSRRCDEVSYEKSATYNSIVASATTSVLANNLIYSHLFCTYSTIIITVGGGVILILCKRKQKSGDTQSISQSCTISTKCSQILHPGYLVHPLSATYSTRHTISLLEERK